MMPKKTIIFGTCFVACFLAGCSNAPPPIQQSTAADIDAAKQENALYVKANGDWNALSAQDQATFNKLAGSPQVAQSTWKLISQHDSRRRTSGAPGGSSNPQEQAAKGGYNFSPH